jgi:hypothetical protein
LRIASRRAALAPLSPFSGSADFAPASVSSSLHDGHRFANPGFPGFNSNSSPQTTQTLIGYDTQSTPMILKAGLDLATKTAAQDDTK